MCLAISMALVKIIQVQKGLILLVLFEVHCVGHCQFNCGISVKVKTLTINCKLRSCHISKYTNICTVAFSINGRQLSAAMPLFVVFNLSRSKKLRMRSWFSWLNRGGRKQRERRKSQKKRRVRLWGNSTRKRGRRESKRWVHMYVWHASVLWVQLKSHLKRMCFYKHMHQEHIHVDCI